MKKEIDGQRQAGKQTDSSQNIDGGKGQVHRQTGKGRQTDRRVKTDSQIDRQTDR